MVKPLPAEKNRNDSISYRPMAMGEEPQVFELVERVFNEFVRDDFPREGIEEFFRAAGSMIFDHSADHSVLVAVALDKVVGMIDMKDNRHISLFFVDKAHHGKGIGRGLLHHAIERCLLRAPENGSIDVNASLYSVPIYEKFGFRRTKPEQTINGIRFVEMVKSLKP